MEKVLAAQVTRRKFVKTICYSLLKFNTDPLHVFDPASDFRLKPHLSEEKIQFLASHELVTGDVTRPVIMLTYDDVGSEQNVDKILKALYSVGGKATFFINRQQFLLAPKAVLKILANGHELGCHGSQHVYFTEMNDDEINQDLELFMLTASQIIPGYEFRYFRFPYGFRDERTRRIIAEWGMQSVYWSRLSGGDEVNNTISAVTTIPFNGMIVLSHLHRQGDIGGASEIVKRLSERGFSLETVDTGKDPNFRYKSNLEKNFDKFLRSRSQNRLLAI